MRWQFSFRQNEKTCPLALGLLKDLEEIPGTIGSELLWAIKVTCKRAFSSKRGAVQQR